jgi:membrane glycosyltransferase
MEKKDLSTHKRKYQAFRHHAWAGLGFLSVALAIRIIFSESAYIYVLTPIIFALIIYIVVALILTYKYRIGLSSEEKIVQVEPSVELEKERLKAEVEKQRLKTEKKKAKAEAKKAKKK